MKHMSIRLSDDHAAQIEATGKDPSETIQAALNLYFQQDRSRTREEALMLISAAISAHEAQHHNKPFPNVPYRVTVKKSESPNFVANNEAQRDTKDAETRKVEALTLGPEVVKRALVFILSELEADREPTKEQVSKALGIDSRQLGKALSKLGIKSKSIHRGGKSVRIYPLASKARVWELAALDTEGLQEMSAGRARATENEKEHDREHFTVFD